MSQNSSSSSTNDKRAIRALAAFDKFKGTLDAESVGNTVLRAYAKAISMGSKNVQTRNIPLSDGGEGFITALKDRLSLEIKPITVTGPLGDPVNCVYGMTELHKATHNGGGNANSSNNNPSNEKIAVVEMAQSSGLYLVPNEKRNPYNTTTRGLGEVMMAAYNQGCKKILLGIGGSATNDGGLGALQAMGLAPKCKSREGALYEPDVFYGRDLLSLERLDLPNNSNSSLPLIKDLQVDIACDVENPFVGQFGAVNVFSAQKGATRQQQAELEEAMKRLAEIMKELPGGFDVSDMEGAGAAGGVGGSFAVILGAKLRRGSEILADYLGLEQAIKNSDIVFTGEGSYDSQTEKGKVVSLVQKLCKKYNVPLVIVCGKKEVSPSDDVPIFDILSMYSMEEAMTKTPSCLENLVLQNASKFPQV